jgi:hypothetical protein
VALGGLWCLPLRAAWLLRRLVRGGCGKPEPTLERADPRRLNPKGGSVGRFWSYGAGANRGRTRHEGQTPGVELVGGCSVSGVSRDSAASQRQAGAGRRETGSPRARMKTPKGESRGCQPGERNGRGKVGSTRQEVEKAWRRKYAGEVIPRFSVAPLCPERRGELDPTRGGLTEGVLRQSLGESLVAMPVLRSGRKPHERA